MKQIIPEVPDNITEIIVSAQEDDWNGIPSFNATSLEVKDSYQ